MLMVKNRKICVAFLVKQFSFNLIAQLNFFPQLSWQNQIVNPKSGTESNCELGDLSHDYYLGICDTL